LLRQQPGFRAVKGKIILEIFDKVASIDGASVFWCSLFPRTRLFSSEAIFRELVGIFLNRLVVFLSEILC
jgi:hypothetical protein